MVWVMAYISQHPVFEIAIVISVVTLIAALAWKFRQPALVWYIIAGLVLSPFVTATEQITTMAHIGISLLLFMVGIGISPRIMKEVWKVSLIAWLWQVVFTSLIGFGILMLLSYAWTPAIYIAIALTFSSTIVIVKLISDNGDTHSLYGKIALWILLIQDIVAILILMTLSSLWALDWAESLWLGIWKLVVTTIFLLWWLFLIVKYALPWMLRQVSHSQELMLLFAMAWCLLLWWIFAYAWLSMEIWALLAWVSLATFSERYMIMWKIKPLRDFFISLFFVYLWAKLHFWSIQEVWLDIVILSVFVLIWNPIIVYTLMRLMKYDLKTNIMTWLTVAQISEFSFIVISMGIAIGHIQDDSVLVVVTGVGLITMIWSSYAFVYAEKIIRFSRHYLSKDKGEIQEQKNILTPEVVVIWYGTHAQLLRKTLPQTQYIELQQKESKEDDVMFADANDEHTREHIDMSRVNLVVVTTDDIDTNTNVLHFAKHFGKKLHVLGMADNHTDAQFLYGQGIDYVLIPQKYTVDHSIQIIEKIWNNDHRDSRKQDVEYIERVVRTLWDITFTD